MLSKSKEKTIGTCFKSIESLVKTVVLYAGECWGDSQKIRLLQAEMSSFISQCRSKYYAFTNVSKISKFFQKLVKHS